MWHSEKFGVCIWQRVVSVATSLGLIALVQWSFVVRLTSNIPASIDFHTLPASIDFHTLIEPTHRITQIISLFCVTHAIPTQNTWPGHPDAFFRKHVSQTFYTCRIINESPSKPSMQDAKLSIKLLMLLTSLRTRCWYQRVSIPDLTDTDKSLLAAYEVWISAYYT